MKNIEETIFESLKNDLLDHVNKEIIGQTRQICEELTGEPSFLDALYELVDAAEESIRAELYPKPVKPVKPSKPAPKKSPRFASMFQFAEEFLLPTYGTTKSQSMRVAWSPEWWSHPEALTRIEALWKRFEQLRLKDPETYVETFLRTHCDYHMKRLMDPNGVFSQCVKGDYPTVPLRSKPRESDSK